MKDKAADIVDAWVALYDTAPPFLQDGEKTVTQISREMSIDMKTAKRFIAQWVQEGKLIEVGMRRSHSGRAGLAYKLK
jgi:hypothetical protein